MTGAELPPIAREAVRKILAIGQESATVKKRGKPAAKPKMRLELSIPEPAFDPRPTQSYRATVMEGSESC